MSSAAQRVIDDMRLRSDLMVSAMRPYPKPADGTGHQEWTEQVAAESAYVRDVSGEGHGPTWADYLRLHTAAALAAGNTTTLRRELLDLGGVIVGWVADLDTRPAHQQVLGSGQGS